MKKMLIAIVLIIVLAVAGVLIWGSVTNWGKSFDGEEASRYCYTACVNLDRDKYCIPDLIVSFNDGRAWADVNCDMLSMNQVSPPCEDIECP